MSCYEIMMVVDGDIDFAESESKISNLLSLFSNLPSYRVQTIENDTLAYPIKGRKTGHRFILNFELEDKSILFEFNRLALLNQSLLRHLVINESKSKGFRAKKNAKKIADYEIRQQKYKKYLENRKSFY